MRRFAALNLVWIIACLIPWVSPCGVNAQERLRVTPEAIQEARQLREQRAALDRTVWSQEEQAQEYETVFIEFWDALRSATNPYAVLREFPIGRLALGVPAAQASHDWGIMETVFTAPTRELDAGAWRKWLDDFESRGYEISATEWHHSQFEPREGTTPRSIINFVVLAMNPKQRQRFTCKGVLEVEWSDDKDERGRWKPELLRVLELKLWERTGEVAFEPIDVLQGNLPRARSESFEPVVVYDLDADGLSEILLVGWNLVLRNRGEFRFEAERLAIVPMLTVQSALVADVTGDARVDLVCVGQAAGNASTELYLYRADESGGFSAQAEPVLPDALDLNRSYSLTAGDIDADGDLDLFVPQYKAPYVWGQMPTPYFDANDGHPAYLLRNDGNGRFTEITDAAGLSAKRRRRSYSSSFVDLDQDRDLDLLVVSDFAGLDLYANDGRGHFTDVTKAMVDEPAAFGMSHTLADFNRDGLLDFLMVGMSSTTAKRLHQMGAGRDELPQHQEMRLKMAYGNRLYYGLGSHQFAQPPCADQIARSGWSWGSSAFDFDNDADADVYIANGHISSKSARDYCTTFWRHDIYVEQSKENMPLAVLLSECMTDMRKQGVSWNPFENDPLYMNEGGEAFVDVGHLFGATSMEDSREVITDDFDADGRMDLLFVTALPAAGGERGAKLNVLHNRWSGEGHWVGVRLRDEGPHGSPLGAKVTVHYDAGAQTAVIVSGDSYRAQHAASRHFGLGAARSVSKLEIEWPDGHRRVIDRPPIDTYHEVVRGTR